MKQAIITRTFIINNPDEFLEELKASYDDDGELNNTPDRVILQHLSSQTLEDHANNDYKHATLCHFIEEED